MIRHGRPSSRIAGGRASRTSVFRAGGVPFGLSSGKERYVNGQVPDIADDGFKRGFDAVIPSLGFPGEGFNRGFDPLEPLFVPAFGALAEVREDRDDDRRSEDDADDADPFLTSHGGSSAGLDANRAPVHRFTLPHPRSIRLRVGVPRNGDSTRRGAPRQAREARPTRVSNGPTRRVGTVNHARRVNGVNENRSGSERLKRSPPGQVRARPRAGRANHPGHVPHRRC